jgi:hypothetical protein
MTTVWIYVDTNKEIGDVDHLKVTPELAEEWFKENDPEGAAFAGCRAEPAPTTLLAVQVRIIVCLLLLTTIVVAVHYGLRQLAHSVDLATFFGHLWSGRACRDRHCFHMGPAISAPFSN